MRDSAAVAAGLTDPPLRAKGRVLLRGRATPVVVFAPVPELSRDEAAAQGALVRSAALAQPDALARLRALAETRPDDRALATLCEQYETTDGGGVLVLD